MAARAETPAGGNAWRLWALGPILLLAVVVGLFVTSGSSLVDLIGHNPPPADIFELRRVEFRPGEIKIRVTNPQADAITIASVTAESSASSSGSSRSRSACSGCPRYDAPSRSG